jgi:hypothetical protein
MNLDSGLTRRSLLRVGAGAGAAVVIGVRPWGAAAAAATPPGHLTRSGYAGLEGTSFTVETGADPVVLRLESIADVAGAATRRALAGSEDSFALTFSGPLGSPLDSGIHALRHPQLGSFELFASPVDQPEGSRKYEVVVDRSVPEESAAHSAPTGTDRSPDVSLESGRSQEQPPAAPLRRVSLRRAGRWLRCELVLGRSVDAERVRVRLMRDGHVLARRGGPVEDGRVVLRLEGDRPLTAARYTLIVTTVDADGTHRVERRRVTVR